MKTRFARRRLIALSLFALPCAWAQAPGDFAGRYGHGATASADDTVWVVQRTHDAWQVRLATTGQSSGARRLTAEGRTAFWDRMMWPAATATDADCLTWGEKPASLADALAAMPADAEDAHGEALLCHVPAAARRQIDWLSTNASDWFYYDPMFGVMEVRPLR